MIKGSKIILLITFSFLFFACNSEQKKEEEQKIKLQELKTKLIKDLTKQYNIKYRLDTLSWPEYYFTIDFKPVISSKYQLIENVEIIDIYEKDSSEIVSTRIGYEPAFYIDFLLNKEHKTILRNSKDENILVVSISGLKKIKFALEDEKANEDMEGNRIVSTHFLTEFIGKGEIIKIISLKNNLIE